MCGICVILSSLSLPLSLSLSPSLPLPLSLLLSSQSLNTAHHVHTVHFWHGNIFQYTQVCVTRYFSLTKLGHSAHSWVLHHRIWLFGWLRACGTTTIPSLGQNLYNHMCVGLHRLTYVVFCLSVPVNGKKACSVEHRKTKSSFCHCQNACCQIA